MTTHIVSGYRSLCRRVEPFINARSLWTPGDTCIFWRDMPAESHRVDCGECLAVAAAVALREPTTDWRDHIRRP